MLDHDDRCREEERGENSGEKILDLISMKYKKNKQNADDSTQRRGGGGGDTGGEEEEEKIKKISLFLKSEVWSEKFMCRREKSPGHTCTRLRGAAGGASGPGTCVLAYRPSTGAKPWHRRTCSTPYPPTPEQDGEVIERRNNSTLAPSPPPPLLLLHPYSIIQCHKM